VEITKIEEQKKNKDRCNIYIDGKYHSSIDKEILEELNFREGMELNMDEFDQKMEIIQYKSALRAALNILARSAKTKNEIKKSLTIKGHSDAAISSVLEYLSEIGYIDDESYAESYVRSNRDNSGTSKKSIYYKLASKGVDSEVIRLKLEEAEIDDYSSALKAANKKLRGLKGDKRERAAKLLNFLYRKGFSMEVCRRVIDKLELEDSFESLD
jgi:regulatory protein